MNDARLDRYLLVRAHQIAQADGGSLSVSHADSIHATVFRIRAHGRVHEMTVLDTDHRRYAMQESVDTKLDRLRRSIAKARTARAELHLVDEQPTMR
jgi:hypothetical protein